MKSKSKCDIKLAFDIFTPEPGMSKMTQFI